MVKNSIEQYFEDLGGHETINLYELVLKMFTLRLRFLKTFECIKYVAEPQYY